MPIGFLLRVSVPLWFACFHVYAADPPHWLKAKWGAGEAEVVAALGGEALRLDPPIEYGALGARLAVKGVMVGGVAMTALYQFDADDKLRQVLLERREPGVDPKNLAAIEAALTAGLGKSVASCDKPSGSPKLMDRQWRADGDAVRLTLMDFMGAAMRYDSNRDITDPRVPSYEYTLFSRRSVPKRIVLRRFPASDRPLEGPPPCS